MKADKINIHISKKDILRIKNYLNFAYEFAVSAKMPMEQDNIKITINKIDDLLLTKSKNKSKNNK